MVMRLLLICRCLLTSREKSITCSHIWCLLKTRWLKAQIVLITIRSRHHRHSLICSPINTLSENRWAITSICAYQYWFIIKVCDIIGLQIILFNFYRSSWSCHHVVLTKRDLRRCIASIKLIYYKIHIIRSTKALMPCIKEVCAWLLYCVELLSSPIWCYSAIGSTTYCSLECLLSVLRDCCAFSLGKFRAKAVKSGGIHDRHILANACAWSTTSLPFFAKINQSVLTNKNLLHIWL